VGCIGIGVRDIFLPTSSREFCGNEQVVTAEIVSYSTIYTTQKDPSLAKYGFYLFSIILILLNYAFICVVEMLYKCI